MNQKNHVAQLAELTIMLNSATSEKQIYDLAAQYMPSMIETDRATVTLLVEKGTKVQFISLVGVTGDTHPGELMDIQGTSIEEAITQRMVSSVVLFLFWMMIKASFFTKQFGIKATNSRARKKERANIHHTGLKRCQTSKKPYKKVEHDPSQW